MRLLSLELHGFKSFPDKTLLKFAPGVTSVVGPNGSGKSNIADAIRWVLGEISSKSMRGSKMDDVIFSGSDTRKPMSFAEVSLTMDNREENGFARMPIDYDEVTITRRITRSTEKGGGSDYFINRKPARLKDINTLFMNTGIGRDGYSIVSQGKAAEIISQKSDERRNVFEEAAGISKHRYQKNEAEKNYNEVSANFERIADILEEKGNALSRLKNDAERAKKYLEIYEKKKEADVSLIIYNTRDITAKLDELQTNFNNTQSALNTVDANLADAEAERDKLELLQSQAKELFARLSTEIENLTNSKYQQDTNAQVLKSNVDNLRSRIAEYNTQLEVLKLTLKDHIDRENQSKTALAEITEKRNEAEATKNQISDALAELNTQLEKCDLKIENNLTETDELEEKQVERRMRIAAIDATTSSSGTRQKEIKQELDALQSSLTNYTAQVERSKSRVDNYQNQLETARNAETANNDKIKTLQQNISNLNSKISELASDLRDIKTRTETLRRMEELFEGYPHSVSAIMNASKAGKLNGIIGPLSHIFSVSSKYAVPIETALASTLQHIVCDNSAAAEAAIDWLMKNNAGRTTFYPLNTMHVSPLQVDMKMLTARKGFIGIASDLIEYEPKFDRVIKSLLGKTLVFDNLKNASSFSNDTGYRIKIVTLDGNQINSSGSYTGGSRKKDSGLLNRGAEIDRLNADKLKVEAEKNAAQDELNVANKELTDALKASDNISAKLNLLNAMYQAESNQYAASQVQLNTALENETHIKAQLDDIDNANKLLEEERATLVAEQDQAEEYSTQLAKILEALNTDKATINGSIRTTTEKLNAATMTVFGFDKDVESANRDLEFKESQRTECENNIRKTGETINSLENQIASMEKTILESSDKVSEMDAELEKKISERTTTNNNSLLYEQKLSKLYLNMQEIMRSREVLSNDYTKLDSKINTIAVEKDRYINYLSEEYNLTFSDAEALDYPPVTEETHDEVTKQLNEMKNKLRGIGSVDPTSIETYQNAKDEYDALYINYEDLQKSRDYYANTVVDLEEQMKSRFLTVIGEINEAFQRSFSELFGGGRAEVVLTDLDDVLHCGIDINVAPPGKIIKSLSLLSGGEQAFISIALVFALLHVNPSPFCIFDEIEAALDEVNVAMFANYIKKYSDNTQFITITHRRGTMEVGDTLYGVTMAERGISRVLSINVSDVESKLGIKF